VLGYLSCVLTQSVLPNIVYSLYYHVDLTFALINTYYLMTFMKAYLPQALENHYV